MKHTFAKKMKPPRAYVRGILHFFGGIRRSTLLRIHPLLYSRGLLRRRIKTFVPILISLLLVLSVAAEEPPAGPQQPTKPFKGELIKSINDNVKGFAEEGAGYSGNVSVAGVIAVFIQILLGVLGIVFVSLMIYGGYLWLTARGNEERVTEAKDTIRHAVWGLAITLGAWSISYFIIYMLSLRVVGGEGTGPGVPDIGAG